MLLHYSTAVIYEAVECVWWRPRRPLKASEANDGLLRQCFVALDLDFSQVSANFTAFAKLCLLPIEVVADLADLKEFLFRQKLLNLLITLDIIT